MKNTIQLNGERYVCRIFDNGGASVDRYAIAFRGVHISGRGMFYPYLASSENPFSPQGFGQHGAADAFITGKHLGRRVSFESLPADVQKFIVRELT